MSKREEGGDQMDPPQFLPIFFLKCLSIAHKIFNSCSIIMNKNTYFDQVLC